MHGEKDNTINPEEAKEVAEIIGNNAKFVMIEKCGHVSFIESYEDLMNFYNLIAEFIKQK